VSITTRDDRTVTAAARASVNAPCTLLCADAVM
jgi:hypothetical protein